MQKRRQFVKAIEIQRRDFIIGEEEVEFEAIRSLLASISEVFGAMVFGEMKESKPDAVIKVDDVDPKAFQSVLNYAYCIDPRFNIENVISIKHICRKYQITKLSKRCDRYFESAINAQTVCSLLNDAMNYKMNGYV